MKASIQRCAYYDTIIFIDILLDLVMVCNKTTAATPNKKVWNKEKVC